MRRPWLLVGPLALVVAATVVWWSQYASPPDASPVPQVVSRASPPPPPVAEPSVPRAAPIDPQTLRMQATAGPPQYAVDPPSMLGDDIDSLHARATAGDLAAMRILGTGLHACLSRWRDPDAREPYRQLQTELQGNSDGKRPHADLDRQSYDRYERAMARHVDCLALGKERASTGLGWLERAARAGDLDAKVAFARMALDDNAYADDGEMYADLDEVIRRRDLADAWVRDAIASGERRALADIANGNENMVTNARDRAVYSLAWSLVL